MGMCSTAVPPDSKISKNGLKCGKEQNDSVDYGELSFGCAMSENIT